MGAYMRPILIAVALSCASTSYAQTTPDQSALPELQQDALLPQIARAMRATLRDPSSVTDLTLCAPTRVKIRDGRPVRWSVLMAFNTRNAYGGYEGRTYYAALFNAGQPTRLDAIMPANAQGLDSLITRSIGHQMIGCPRVSDDRLHSFMVSGE